MTELDVVDGLEGYLQHRREGFWGKVRLVTCALHVGSVISAWLSLCCMDAYKISAPIVVFSLCGSLASYAVYKE